MAAITVTQNGQTISYDPTTQKLITDPATGQLMRVDINYVGGNPNASPTQSGPSPSATFVAGPATTVIAAPQGPLSSSLYKTLDSYLQDLLQSIEVTGNLEPPGVFRNNLIVDAQTQCAILGGNDPNCRDGGVGLANHYADLYEQHVATLPSSPKPDVLVAAPFINTPGTMTPAFPTTSDNGLPRSQTAIVNVAGSQSSVGTQSGNPGSAVIPLANAAGSTPSIVSMLPDFSSIPGVSTVENFFSGLTPMEMLIGVGVLGILGFMLANSGGDRGRGRY